MRKLCLTFAAMLTVSAPVMAQDENPKIHGMIPGGHYRHSHRDWSTPGHHRHNPCWHNHYGKWVWIC